MRYVQEEYCLLSVGGNYSVQTQSIHTNPAQFTPEIVEQLRASATLAAIPPEMLTLRVFDL